MFGANTLAVSKRTNRLQQTCFIESTWNLPANFIHRAYNRDFQDQSVLLLARTLIPD